MSVTVKNFAVVQLPVRNLEKSVAWYRDVLGLPFTFAYTPGDDEAWLNVGGVGLGLVRSADVPSLEFANMKGVLQPILSLQVEDIHSAYEALVAQGADIGEMTFKPEGGHSFTFRDPDGHVGNLWGGWPKE